VLRRFLCSLTPRRHLENTWSTHLLPCLALPFHQRPQARANEAEEAERRWEDVRAELSDVRVELESKEAAIGAIARRVEIVEGHLGQLRPLLETREREVTELKKELEEEKEVCD